MSVLSGCQLALCKFDRHVPFSFIPTLTDFSFVHSRVTTMSRTSVADLQSAIPDFPALPLAISDEMPAGEDFAQQLRDGSQALPAPRPATPACPAVPNPESTAATRLQAESSAASLLRAACASVDHSVFVCFEGKASKRSSRVMR